MYGRDVRAEVARRRALGDSVRQVAAALSISTWTVQSWRDQPVDRPVDARCWRCNGSELPDALRAPYGYLLGQYLGDGYLVASARVPVLRFACANAYPAIAQEVDTAMASVSGGSRPCAVQRTGCSDRLTYWKHWPCVLPQHGPGRKHERPIVLEPWQQQIVDADPWPLIRGLIHSDGCRAINRVVVRGRTYEYPRYFFANESRDILGIAGRALDLAGVEWRFNRPNSISVARRAAVALMEQHVGAKT